MPSYTINAETAKTLLDFRGQVQICDESGKVIGTFQPQYSREAPHSIAEIDAMRKSYRLSDCKTTEDILKKWEL